MKKIATTPRAVKAIALLLALPVYLFGLMLTLSTTFLVILSRADDGNAAEGVGNVLSGMLSDRAWWLQAGLVAVGITVLQLVFLLPVLSGRPPAAGRRSRRLTLSLLIGGLIAGLLTGGLGFAVVDAVVLSLGADEPSPALWLLVVGAWLGGWVFWTIVILMASRNVWPDKALGRLAAALLAGTIVETLIVLPVDIMIRRKTDCYCATGSFFALAIGATVVLWLSGPGVVIALLSPRHRRWRETHCGGCGHPFGPSPGAQCPECGEARMGYRPREGGALAASRTN